MQTLTSPSKLAVRRADHFFSRLAGLLFSPPLQPGQGLLIVPCAAVHTAFMRFSIDVVFLDGAGRIQKIVPHLKPWRAATCSGAWQTLELAAGEAQRLELAVGISLARSLQGFNQESGA
ncbi:MAG: DUF192 domain-containing protein [Thiobacillus sp.]|nr:DUF192 domain-containing protein [Thiobacillus sp.]